MQFRSSSDPHQGVTPAAIDHRQIAAALRRPVVVVILGDLVEPLVPVLGRRTERLECGAVALNNGDCPVDRRRRFNAPMLNHPGEVVGTPGAGDTNANRPIGKAIRSSRGCRLLDLIRTVGDRAPYKLAHGTSVRSLAQEVGPTGLADIVDGIEQQ